jgi:hypothetical protein
MRRVSLGEARNFRGLQAFAMRDKDGNLLDGSKDQPPPPLAVVMQSLATAGDGT